MTDDFLLPLHLLGARGSSGCWPDLGWRPWFGLLPCCALPWSLLVLEGADVQVLGGLLAFGFPASGSKLQCDHRSFLVPTADAAFLVLPSHPPIPWPSHTWRQEGI